jgi:outer membrane protein assembly factor BamB
VREVELLALRTCAILLDAGWAEGWRYHRGAMTRSVGALPRLVGLASAVISLVVCGNGVMPTGQQLPQPASEVWTTYRGDLQRDGHPSTATLDASASVHLKLAWRANMGAAVDGSPAVSNGLVVAASQGGRIAAYSSASGSRSWEVNGLGPISGSPTIVADRVLAGSLSGHLYAFDLSRGTRLWDWKAPGIQPAIWSSPAVHGQLVLIGIGSQYGDTPLEVGRIVALDLSSGRQVWAMCVQVDCAPGGGIWSTPAVDSDGRAFVGTGNPEDGVLAFDALTGRRLWRVSFYADGGRDLDVGESPVLLQVGGREALAEGSVAGVFKLLDAATGAVIWSRDLVDGSAVHGLIASPAYDGSSIYVPSASPPTGVFALAPEDGAIRWRQGTDQPVYSSPAAGNGVLVFGTGAVFGDVHVGSIVALSSLGGGVLWTYDAHSSVFSSPAIAGTMVVVGDSNGDLFAFRPSS